MARVRYNENDVYPNPNGSLTVKIPKGDTDPVTNEKVEEDTYYPLYTLGT